MIRVGIVGCNSGRLVHLPAFRADPRCMVIALAGTDAARTAELARESNIPLAFGDWSELVEYPDVDVVTIATPPSLQPKVAIRALKLGKSVFAEKPLAANLKSAEAMVRAADVSGVSTTVNFNFPAIPAWRKAKELLDDGAIGRLRHVTVNWNVENYGTRMRLKNWKTLGEDGGGVLGNFVSHVFYYLEWFCGPVSGISARLSGLPDEPAMETNAAIAVAFQSGAAGNITMSCASYLGSGHGVEFYGEDGTMTLINPTPDYMRGFELHLGQRPAIALALMPIDDPADRAFPSDGRIAPVSRLANSFLDAVTTGGKALPGFVEGLRVQILLDAARRSHDARQWLTIEPAGMELRA